MIHVALIVTLAAGLAIAATGDAATTPRVQIKEFAFVPAKLTVPVGTAVTWTNADDETHTVTAVDRAYTSTALEHNATYAHRFTTPGTYTYFCMLHPHMTATVVVQ
jgi:plastocyanin